MFLLLQPKLFETHLTLAYRLEMVLGNYKLLHLFVILRLGFEGLAYNIC